jgi:hypothetical protein
MLFFKKKKVSERIEERYREIKQQIQCIMSEVNIVRFFLPMTNGQYLLSHTRLDDDDEGLLSVHLRAHPGGLVLSLI